MDRICANLSALASTWSAKVWSTSKPSRASSAAGRSSERSDRLPQRSRASSQVATVPGVPTDSPLVTSSSNG